MAKAVVSKIEAELVKASGIKQGDNPRSTFLEDLMFWATGNKITDEQWHALTDEAADWVEAAGKAYDAKEPILDFPDAPQQDEEEEEEEVEPERKLPTPPPPAAAKAKPAPAKPAPKTVKGPIKTAAKPASKPAAKPAPTRARHDDHADERAPARKGKAAPPARHKAAPARPAPKTAKDANGGGGIRKLRTVVAGRSEPAQALRKMMLSNPNLSVEDLKKRIKAQGVKLSPAYVAVSRSHFLGTLKAALEAGWQPPKGVSASKYDI